MIDREIVSRCEHHHHHTLHRGGEGRAHGGHHEERQTARPGAARPPHGASPGTDTGEGLPQTLHRDRVRYNTFVANKYE